jgi:hypothetical protein
VIDMSKLGGRWLKMSALHACPTPLILGGIFAPKVGAVWECDCGQQWVIQSHQPPDVPGARASLRWQEVKTVQPSRSQVLDRLMTLLPAQTDATSEERTRDYFALALEYLERLNLAAWSTDAR